MLLKVFVQILNFWLNKSKSEIKFICDSNWSILWDYEDIFNKFAEQYEEYMYIHLGVYNSIVCRIISRLSGVFFNEEVFKI